MPKVYIVGGNGKGYGRMFLDAGWELARGPLQADLIQFTGGADVTPAIYGEKTHPHTGYDFDRDVYEAGFFAIAQRMGIPMAGICRGGQFLNVMSGGTMYQHVGSHATGKNHELIDVSTGRAITVSSTHHQMMIGGRQSVLVATANLGGFKEFMTDKVHRDEMKQPDVESVYYPTTKALCFQPHPEFFEIEEECPQYYFELLERYHGMRA